MIAEWVMTEMEKTFIRYKAGKISLDRSKQDMTLLLLMLKAYDLTVMEQRLTKLEESIAGGNR